MQFPVFQAARATAQASRLSSSIGRGFRIIYPQGSLKHASLRAYVDDKGRLLAIGTHNTDIADGWERESYGQWYFERYSTLSYRLAINIIVYVMTH